ncbi:MAG TPA: hypothetical protein VG077_11780 [Verrucomicrobiae bacterium]|nr:hypothetical protein [Verrucomicrobiae bacterium]
MKTRLLFFGGLALMAAIALAVVLIIQARVQAQTVTDTSGRLQEAVTLLNQGQPQAAQAMLATIPPSDPNYTEARGYSALCLYQTNSLKFLKIMQSPELQMTNLSDSLCQELTYDQIDTLFSYRQFEKLLPRLQDFITRYTNSPLLHAALEYQMATWYERGMKKIDEARGSGDPKVFQRRYPDGRSNLVDFLHLAATLNETNYQTLPKRSLVKEIWTAEIALGEDQQAQDETPSAYREEEAFLSLRLYENYLQPRKAWSAQTTEDNLRRMTNFLNEFPESKHCKRVRFDMAAISFPMVEVLYNSAMNAQGNHDTNAATGDRLKAQAYLQLTETLTNELYVDQAAGIAADDVLGAQADLLHGYYLGKNYAKMLEMTAMLVTNSTPGGITWLMAKTYRGTVFQAEDPPDLKQAAAELDDVLAYGFNQKAEHDHWVLAATCFRISIARRSGDQAKVTALYNWVQGANCKKDQKAWFLKDWSDVLIPANTNN